MSLLGIPIQGSLIFSAQIDAALDRTHKVIIVPAPIVVTLDSHGKLDVVVPATDDTDILPLGFTYLVKETWAGGRTYSITAPANGLIDLVNVSTVSSAPGSVNYYVTDSQYFALLAAVAEVLIIDGGASASPLGRLVPAGILDAGARA